MIRYTYAKEATVKAEFHGREIVVAVTRYRVHVTSLACDKLGHAFAEAHAKATLSAIRQGRALYRRMFGRRAP